MGNYVNFVDWFVTRYKREANIKYVELFDCPVRWWKGTPEQLADLTNKAYERIKGKYPEILVGTPGFEYWVDTPLSDKSVREIEYFLDRKNNVKFDYWAFHGYPGIDFTSLQEGKVRALYPPTKRALINKYVGPAGILEIRKRLDGNGWSDRGMIDTEHHNMSEAKSVISDEEDIFVAAYTVQELVIKRTLMLNGRPALRGIVSLKIAPRGSKQDFRGASMKPDGSPTMTVKAAGLLMSKLKDIKYASHISGEFDAEDLPWIEKFRTDRKELYIFFKPFRYLPGKEIAFDDQTIRYTLTFGKKPAALILTGADGSVTYPTPAISVTVEAINMPRFLEAIY
jgi:hypothetical protein